ncbi:hypothetical protein [Parasphingorhabdus sp.]|uniref:hypothetical protein n=1 Tax=Parasphingorhabdus sp. TaxID=2709688 RepID=UPI003002EE09
MEFISFTTAIVLPVWISFTVFHNASDSRHWTLNWFLAVLGGPMSYGALALLFFLMSGSNFGHGLADAIIVLAASLASATICAVTSRRSNSKKLKA